MPWSPWYDSGTFTGDASVIGHQPPTSTFAFFPYVERAVIDREFNNTANDGFPNYPNSIDLIQEAQTAVDFIHQGVVSEPGPNFVQGSQYAVSSGAGFQGSWAKTFYAKEDRQFLPSETPVDGYESNISVKARMAQGTANIFANYFYGPELPPNWALRLADPNFKKGVDYANIPGTADGNYYELETDQGPTFEKWQNVTLTGSTLNYSDGHLAAGVEFNPEFFVDLSAPVDGTFIPRWADPDLPAGQHWRFPFDTPSVYASDNYSEPQSQPVSVELKMAGVPASFQLRMRHRYENRTKIVPSVLLNDPGKGPSFITQYAYYNVSNTVSLLIKPSPFVSVWRVPRYRYWIPEPTGTQFVRLRLSQRDDGRGIVAYPRIAASVGTTTAKYDPLTARIGDTNRQDGAIIPVTTPDPDPGDGPIIS